MSIITESLLINKQDDIAEIISEHNANMNESYFFSALEFLAESKMQLRENSKILYKSILESGNDPEIITEAFSDFTAKAKEIIDKFIAFIKSVFARFITFLNSIVKSDKYLLKHEKDFANFASRHEFDYEGYVFSIDPSIPKTNMVDAEWSKDFLKLDFDNADSKIDLEGNPIEFVQYVKNIYAELCNDLENTYYDTFRGMVLGKTDSINSNDFAAELFAIYRNGSSDKETLTINSRYVSEAFLRFKGYEKAKKEAKNTQTNLEKEYKSLKDSISKLVTKQDKQFLVNGTHKGEKLYDVSIKYANDEVMQYVDKFIKLKVDQVNQMSTIHILAFTAKLDAMKDCFVQDKTILYKALSRTQSLKKGDK